MSQNVWATIMPFGPVTLIFYWPKIFFRLSFQALDNPTYTFMKRGEGMYLIRATPTKLPI